MIIEKINLDDVIIPDYNPRKISDKDKEKLKKSIQEFNYIDPIIVNKQTMHVVGGNQRVSVLRELGYTEIDAVIIDEPLSKEKALNIALNKISGDWDSVKLEDLLKELPSEELQLTGFDELELNLYLDGDLDVGDLLSYDEDEEYELPSDYMDVTGHDANKNYVVSIAFPSIDDANEFVSYFGCEKTMKRDTLQLHIDELNMSYI